MREKNFIWENSSTGYLKKQILFKQIKFHLSSCQISSSLFIFQNCYFINDVKNSVIGKEDNLNMVGSSFKIVNIFPMLAGEGRMMTEGKGE